MKMKKKININFNKALYILFIITTIIIIFIAVKNIQNHVVVKFVKFYICFVILFSIYIVIVLVLKIFKLDAVEFKKRLKYFLLTLIILGGINYIIDFIIRPEEISFSREFSIPFGLAISGAFFDLIFSSKKKNNDKSNIL